MVLTAPRAFLRELRLEHTLFALPFAYTGAIFAAHGLPSYRSLLWITIAVLGARTAAMSANRYLDRDIDARNPRTASRALPSGKLDPASMLWAAAIGLALLVLAAWELNPLCVKLLPLAALGVLGYPICKRFTWLTHFVLGAVDGFAPLGAFIAVSGTVTAAALLLFAAVTLWVAGFDVLYALMDLPIDRAQGIRSLPARFGELGGRFAPIGMHISMLLLLWGAGALSHAGPLYGAGLVAAIALLAYEYLLLGRMKDPRALNDRVFTANMAFSVIFMLTTLSAFTLR